MTIGTLALTGSYLLAKGQQINFQGERIEVFAQFFRRQSHCHFP